MESKRVQVEIAGMTFYVVGGDDADYVKGLADEANSRIKDVENNNYRLNDVQLYILSLLNALDDMHKLERSDQEAGALAGDREAMKEKLSEIEELKHKSESFDEEIKSKDAAIQELEEKNYEAQMRLIDLNKEIYVLRGNHEEK